MLATDECPFASPDQLFDYVEAATRAREYSKFVFSKGLFFILEQIAEFGQRHGISREELALLEVGMLMQCTGETNEIEVSALRAAIDEARAKYEIDVLVHLPQIIDRTESAYVSPYQVNMPNYITSKTIEAPIVMVDGIADPDLFDDELPLLKERTQLRLAVFNKYRRANHEYGGVNSHMAIRCGEFQLPAAIGCGAQIFSDLQSSTMVRLNCSEDGHHILGIAEWLFGSLDYQAREDCSWVFRC